MHKEAYDEAEKFVTTYVMANDFYSENLKILDVGSYDVNGSMKPLFEHDNWEYVGLDMEEGPNVDIIASMTKFPIKSNDFDVVVSSSCFEHAKLFWVTFNEMVRVLKKGGLMYINTPSRGSYHAHPVDCWRFYADSYAALAEWNGKVELVDQLFNQNGAWGDNCGIFRKL